MKISFFHSTAEEMWIVWLIFYVNQSNFVEKVNIKLFVGIFQMVFRRYEFACGSSDSISDITWMRRDSIRIKSVAHHLMIIFSISLRKCAKTNLHLGLDYFFEYRSHWNGFSPVCWDLWICVNRIQKFFEQLKRNSTKWDLLWNWRIWFIANMCMRSCLFELYL